MRGIRNDPKDARDQVQAADFAALLTLSLLAWCLAGLCIVSASVDFLFVEAFMFPMTILALVALIVDACLRRLDLDNPSSQTIASAPCIVRALRSLCASRRKWWHLDCVSEW